MPCGGVEKKKKKKKKKLSYNNRSEAIAKI